MNEPPLDIKVRLLYILHRGFVETRLLAMRNKSEQVLALADALELIPGMIKDWHDTDLDQVQAMLKTYQDKYPLDRFNFLLRLTDQNPPQF